MPRSVITGGAGFLPSHLCDRLLAEGHEVIALDNFITGSPDNIAHLKNNPKFTFIEQDVCQTYEILGDVDFVFHMASPASPVDFTTKAIEILMVNSEGTHHALKLALAKRAVFLMASTSEVYGDPLVHPQPEEYWGNVNPIGVRGAYDEAKRFSEALIMAYRRYKDVDTKIFRIFNTYGPRMRLDDGRVVPNFVGQALRGEPITIYGTGLQTRSFCYVTDLVDGIYRLSQTAKDISGPINIGSPTERTMVEFALEIKRLTGAESEIVYEPLKTADDPKLRCPDNTKAKEILGWEPKVSLEEGLRATIEFFKEKV